MKWLDGIMGVVVGDALGNPVQFNPRGVKTVSGMEGGGAFNTPVGTWTDDSALTIATLDAIRVSRGKIKLGDIMDNFVAWLERGEFTPFGQAFDIGATCMTAIQNYERNHDIYSCGLRDEFSNGNGSLMRIMPVCLAGDLVDAENVSCLTHAHRRTQVACGLYWFMVQELCEGEGSLRQRLSTGLTKGFRWYESEPELIHFERLRDLDAFSTLPEEKIESSGYSVHTLEAAVWSLLQEDGFKGALLRAVNLGDDADSVGAVCGGLAGLYYGYEAIPAEWVGEIQRREWIEQLCKEVEDDKVEG